MSTEPLSFPSPVHYSNRTYRLRPALPTVIEPDRGNAGMPQSLLHLSDVGVMRERIPAGVADEDGVYEDP